MNQVLSQFFQNIGNRLEEKINRPTFSIAIFGNDTVDNLNSQFSYPQFRNSFELRDYSQEDLPEIILIVGPLNRDRLAQVRQFIDQYRDQSKLVIYLRGSLGHEFSQLSSHTVTDLKKYIKVDLELSHFPCDYEELIAKISELKSGVHE